EPAEDRVASPAGSSQGLSGSVGASAGSASGPDRCRAERDSKRRAFTSEPKRARQTPALRAVAERKRPPAQERSRLKASAGSGGNPATTRQVSRRQNLPSRSGDVAVEAKASDRVSQSGKSYINTYCLEPVIDFERPTLQLAWTSGSRTRGGTLPFLRMFHPQTLISPAGEWSARPGSACCA